MLVLLQGVVQHCSEVCVPVILVQESLHAAEPIAQSSNCLLQVLNEAQRWNDTGCLSAILARTTDA